MTIEKNFLAKYLIVEKLEFMKQTLIILNDNKISENFWYQFVDPMYVKVVLIKSLDDLNVDTNFPEPKVIIIDDYFRKKGGPDWIVNEFEGLKRHSLNARFFCLSPTFGRDRPGFQTPILNCECFSFSDEFTRTLRSALYMDR